MESGYRAIGVSRNWAIGLLGNRAIGLLDLEVQGVGGEHIPSGAQGGASSIFMWAKASSVTERNWLSRSAFQVLERCAMWSSGKPGTRAVLDAHAGLARRLLRNFRRL